MDSKKCKAGDVITVKNADRNDEVGTIVEVLSRGCTVKFSMKINVDRWVLFEDIKPLPSNISKEDMMKGKKLRKMYDYIKSELDKGFGPKCKYFNIGCNSCQYYLMLDLLEDWLSLYEPHSQDSTNVHLDKEK